MKKYKFNFGIGFVGAEQESVLELMMM